MKPVPEGAPLPPDDKRSPTNDRAVALQRRKGGVSREDLGEARAGGSAATSGPRGPQTAIEPSLFNAAKAKLFEKISVKPVPEGAPLPPYDAEPHETIEPSRFNAAKAFQFEKTLVKPVPRERRYRRTRVAPNDDRAVGGQRRKGAVIRKMSVSQWPGYASANTSSAARRGSSRVADLAEPDGAVQRRVKKA